MNTRQRRLRTLTLDAASLGMDFEDLHAALVLAVALAKVLRGVEAKGAELLARRLETMAKLCNEAAEALRVEQEQGETG